MELERVTVDDKLVLHTSMTGELRDEVVMFRKTHTHLADILKKTEVSSAPLCSRAFERCWGYTYIAHPACWCN